MSFVIMNSFTWELSRIYSTAAISVLNVDLRAMKLADDASLKGQAFSGRHITDRLQAESGMRGVVGEVFESFHTLVDGEGPEMLALHCRPAPARWWFTRRS